MKFEKLTAQSVKSISQRGLLWRWSELAADRPFPVLKDFDVSSRVVDPKSLLIWQVEREAGDRRLRMRYLGSRVGEALQGDWTGKIMEEMVPQPLKKYALDAANECIDSGCAVYSILSTLDAAGHRIDCERLLLPFGKGVEVEQVMATMELVSPKGTFERHTILNKFKAVAKIELAGRIAAGIKRPNASLVGRFASVAASSLSSSIST